MEVRCEIRSQLWKNLLRPNWRGTNIETRWEQTTVHKLLALKQPVLYHENYDLKASGSWSLSDIPSFLLGIHFFLDFLFIIIIILCYLAFVNPCIFMEEHNTLLSS